jgi:hypothetical protein
MKCDDAKKIALYCSLDWLNNFIDFLRDDFQTVLKIQASRQQEESKD